MRLRASERLQTPLITVWGVEALPAARRVFFRTFPPVSVFLQSLRSKRLSTDLKRWREKKKVGGNWLLCALNFCYINLQKSFFKSLFQYWLILTTLLSLSWIQVLRSFRLRLSETLFIQRLSLYLHLFSSDPLFLKDTVKLSSDPVLIVHFSPVIF